MYQQCFYWTWLWELSLVSYAKHELLFFREHLGSNLFLVESEFLNCFPGFMCVCVFVFVVLCLVSNVAICLLFINSWLPLRFNPFKACRYSWRMCLWLQICNHPRCDAMLVFIVIGLGRDVIILDHRDDDIT